MFNNFFRKNIVPKTDSQEYEILINAVKEIKALDGLTLEIGCYKGGSSLLIMKTLLANNDKKVHIGIDPYGNIDYCHWENRIDKGIRNYTDLVKNEMLCDLYTWCFENNMEFKFFNLEDTEFFNRFSDGVPVYDRKYLDNKQIINDYALVFFDGPHSTDLIKTEITFFQKKILKNGFMVFDDINQYNHMGILDSYILSLGFDIFEKGEFKISYIKC
ncbi:class I SAM-dependent methyltransferase [Candidatus Marinimicrobia bacterium]|nr:class I SAM-dependent methyltransferase [Candidatus Neomarinimicrobiota bacterium]